MNSRIEKKTQEIELSANQEVRDFLEHLDTELRIQRANYLIVFSIIVAILLAGLAYLSIKTSRLEKAYEELLVRADVLKTERDEFGKEIVTLRNNSDTLLKSKIPGLRSFEYDQPYDVNEKYVRRLTFDKSKIGDDQGEAYEVRVTLDNNTEFRIMPDFTLLLFDTNGTVTEYLGVSTMGESFIKTAALRPKESRTDISGVVRVPDVSKRPAYFAIRIR